MRLWNAGRGVAGVRAGGMLWDQMQGNKRPFVRQCLTFAEIAKFRDEDRRQTSEVIMAQAKHGRKTMRVIFAFVYFTAIIMRRNNCLVHQIRR
jgi:hypothetical protein